LQKKTTQTSGMVPVLLKPSTRPLSNVLAKTEGEWMSYSPPASYILIQA